MSTRQYQNSRNNYQDLGSDHLDDLYARLNRPDESQIDLAQNLSNSIKALSKKWLQEAYLDGMMLADQLHKITSQNKTKQNLSENLSENRSPISTAENAQQIAEIVRQEIQKLGLSSQVSPQIALNTNSAQPSKDSKTSDGGFGDFLLGSLLMLSGFFIIGGAIGYYGLGTQISSYISSGYATITGDKSQADSINPSTAKNNVQAANSNTNTATANVKPIPAQLAIAQSQPPVSSSGPALNLPSDNTNLANSASPSQQNPNTTTTTNQVSPQNLPASCNGQLPQTNRPLNIQNPNDRAVLYCILDIQAQRQNTSNSNNIQSAQSTQQNGKTSAQPVPQNPNQMQMQNQTQNLQQNPQNYPDPNSIPQR
jgi:hypothetical protein